MKTATIIVDGNAYPCRSTLGAMLKYQQVTGRDVSEMDGSLTDLFVFLWCCVFTACRHDGIAFNLTLEQFGDSLTPDDLQNWATTIGNSSKEAKVVKKKQ